jgi:cell shape-determining protein MreC
MPTPEQAISAVCVCQSLSDMLQSIYLFRYDPINKQIFILAGINEGIEVIINEKGIMEVLNNDD